MSEEALEQALFRLYLHFHELEGYSSILFEDLPLSSDELAWLKKLALTQKNGLIVFNQQLRAKGTRYIKNSLPKSASRFGVQLGTLLDQYLLTQTEIGPRDPSSAVNAFGTFLERADQGCETDLRAFEFIRFESSFVAMALNPMNSIAIATRLSSNPRRWYLPPTERCKSVSFRSDPTREWDGELSFKNSPSGPCHFLFFVNNAGVTKVIKLSSSLKTLIDGMTKGQTVGEALNRLSSTNHEEFALQSIFDLSNIGLPFLERPLPNHSTG